ncbi:hypothetical protein LTR37_009139 [Vermiconidia calcicola]|uniref:Uncharacterized protein n=1 Tax=Vermiconidia calcicola TaxID=1690605 RepID=A0ACC3N8R3_9PEZI|nr:hypothetical protein LTR37_009139 [Vermiconidia calcicola]
MLEKLYTCSDRGRNNDHVPPVVAFTCIGPRIRVWIAYSYRERDGPPVHLMLNIWERDMTTTWAVLEIQSVLRNLLRWSTKVLRPNISHQISLWRFRNIVEERQPMCSTADERAYYRDMYYGIGVKSAGSEVCDPEHSECQPM